jgi:hypothetical protein
VVTALSFWAMSPAAAIRSIYPHNPFADMPAIAREIESITESDDSVFLFGAEPELLFYARRTSATRYIYLFPLFGPYPDARDRQQDVIDEISSARPAVMVWLPNRMFFKKGAPQLLTDWFKRVSVRDYRIHAFRAKVEAGGTELLRVPKGLDPVAVLRGRRPTATIFVRKDVARDFHEAD